MCTDVFGKKFHANYTYTAILATQAHYGGVEGFKATNVVIPNGSVDPWHRLGKLASDVASVVTYLMKAANTKPLMKPVMRRARTTYPKQEEGTAEEPILLSQMKYYENNKWARLGGPVFLYIGGESPLNSGFVKGYNIYYQHLAVVMGATVFALEHRYYGDSIVGGTAEDPNPDLTYLSSWQMIHDVANFIETMNAKMETKSKWILFGGSYSGDALMDSILSNSQLRCARFLG
ncbi:hypothetical protein ANCCEY_07098 [Ancylostoma ceylanicum]|uniref:Serine carboxypeptidase S28 n=1 Tax=Ancylostoma ceylanicum TaxID=53326 RepID=A0A0D6LRK2_9BILA|nr:hypothetical protein ANCCEY_07098 [Ancylostoma ceylanicum]